MVAIPSAIRSMVGRGWNRQISKFIQQRVKLKNRRHPGWLTRVAERLHGRGTVAAKRSADRAMGVAWRGPHARAGAKDRNAPCSDGGAASIGAPNNFTQGAHCASAIGVQAGCD